VRALALFAAALLTLFLGVECASAHSVASPGRAERAEPKREDCPVRHGGIGGLRLVLPGSPFAPSPSQRSGAAAYDGPADADPGDGPDAPADAPRSGRQSSPLSRSGRSDELPVAHQVFRC
jgi:hypothetical protein